MSFLLGFISGVLASVFAAGMRKMLAPIVFRRKLRVGNIEKFEQNGAVILWCISVDVVASDLWKLVVADIEVRALIGYTEKGGNIKSYFATWVETKADVPFVTLRIGGIGAGIILATVRANQLLPLNGNTGKLFKDDQDIALMLSSGKTILGRWHYEKAIVEGVMQEVEPTKIS